MVRKGTKTSKTKGKKKTRKPSFSAWLTRLTIGSTVSLVLFIGLLFAYSYGYPLLEQHGKQAGSTTEQSVTEPKQSKAKQQAVAQKQTAAKQPSTTAQRENSTAKQQTTASNQPSATSQQQAATAKPLAKPEGVELPKLNHKATEQVIRHEGYTVSYNSDYRLPNWVAYELTGQEAKSNKAQRSNKFVPDPDVKGASAGNEDYTRTGYDRGHMAPAGDMKWSLKAMRESFYLSNICPQAPGLNRGRWNDLEEQCRLWAKENGVLWIATGPLLEKDLERMGKNQVAIPKTFYKVICTIINNEYKGIGFLFENRDYDGTPLETLAVSIDQVEKVTGIDFFPALPDSIEKAMECRVDASVWSF